VCVCVLSNEFSKFSSALKTLHEYVCVPVLCQLLYHEGHISMSRINAVSDD